MDTQKNKHTVMIVDDDPIIRQVLRMILREAGYHVVHEAADGNEGLSAFQHCRPEVVCLDINMPGTDGFCLLEKIKTEQPGTIVIMVTGESSVDAVKESISKGAAGYIVKPFKAAKVIDSLDKTIKAAHRAASA